MNLADRHCTPATPDTPPLDAPILATLSAQLPAWEVIDGHHLRRAFTLPDFKSALALVNLFGEEAEAQGHHPDLELSWGRVVVRLTTHDIGGLSEADFVLAARLERLAERAASADG
jgi:4a-hydroxytetrahydrobiopterin dehydratase